jgi:hypothetical protein
MAPLTEPGRSLPMPAEQSNEKVKGWKLPICTGCGGIFGGLGEPACSCDRSHAKTGKHVEVIPARSPQVLSVEEARLIADNLGTFKNSFSELSPLRRRLSTFAEEADRG